MTTSVIFARNHSNVIGVDQKLPWSFQEDMKWFKQHTDGQVVVMGKNTLVSMGSKGLPNRLNVVVSKQMPFCGTPMSLVSGIATDLTSALCMADSFAGATSPKNVFVIGGAGLIKEAIPLVDRIIMTTVGKPIDARGKIITKLDISGLGGYYNEYMNVDGLPFKLIEDKNGYVVDRMTGETVGIHFTVHERVR